ncbi:AAA family ATPase [Candidatus Woesearchaeota archaeon]|nr:AAA family ATPase [Candidatus Woesearchaeota archaeon]
MAKKTKKKSTKKGGSRGSGSRKSSSKGSRNTSKKKTSKKVSKKKSSKKKTSKKAGSRSSKKSDKKSSKKKASKRRSSKKKASKKKASKTASKKSGKKGSGSGTSKKKSKKPAKSKKSSKSNKSKKEKESDLVEVKEGHVKDRGFSKKESKSAKKDKSKAGKAGKSSNKPRIDVNEMRKKIFSELRSGKIDESEAEIMEQRIPLGDIAEEPESGSKKRPAKEYMQTGIEGIDALIEKGIPKGSTVLVAGGAGSGKTLMSLQILYNHARHGDKCMYMSFEESEERLREHLEDFGLDPRALEKKGTLRIHRFNPFDITRSVDALLMKAKGELLIDIDPVILPKNFKPEIVVVDSLTAIASAFTEKEESYRIYIEQLFRFFEQIGATAFLITETKQVPKVFSTTGVEEFLADGVFVLYSIKKGNVREYAFEVLKLRGTKHHKKIVAMQITDNGILVYPEQEVFSSVESSSDE